MLNYLELRQNNPYSTGYIQNFANEGINLLERVPIVHTKSESDRYFTTIQGDTLQSISFQAYGNSKWWWIIQDVNELDDDLFELPHGKSLLIPDLRIIQISRI